MRAINSNLNTESDTSVLEELKDDAFICHRCEQVFKGIVNELVYAVDIDMIYHEHDDGFFRAFRILENGIIQIGAFDSEEEDVIQLYRIDRPGTADTSESLLNCSRAFFDSMRKQNRKVVPAEVHVM